MSKQYGLIISKNKKPLENIVRPSIFDEDSDSDPPKTLKPTGQTKSRQQDKISQNKALEQDPTVYQYDEIYDEMEQKKLDSKLARKDIDKKPKYISKLLASADRRKRENERRIERQVQKEREAEGDEFKDKESFVTSAYKKKLEEMRALEEQEKREEYLEAIGDVKKQGNLDGFYRHLYDQKVNYEDKIKENDDCAGKEIKKEINDDSDSTEGKRKRRDSESSNKSGGSIENTKIKKQTLLKNRKYRARQESENHKSESENEAVEIKREHLPSNLDADSDFSIDSSSESESEEKKSTNNKTDNKDNKIEHEGEKLQLPEKGNVLSDNAALAKKIEGADKETKEPKDIKENNEEVEDGEQNVEEVKPKKPKVEIWKKRTVGEIFDEALKRYFERKALREATRST